MKPGQSNKLFSDGGMYRKEEIKAAHSSTSYNDITLKNTPKQRSMGPWEWGREIETSFTKK